MNQQLRILQKEISNRLLLEPNIGFSQVDIADGLITAADPFLIKVDRDIYVFFEREGNRKNGKYFKKLAAYKLLGQRIEYVGETWQQDDGEYSFPYLFTTKYHVYLVPDVNEVGNSLDKKFQIYRTSKEKFPKEWTLFHTSKLPNSSNLINDKIIFFHDKLWWLLVSDPKKGGRLLVYYSNNLKDWYFVKNVNIKKRTFLNRIAWRYFSKKLFRYHPWRLAGSAFVIDNEIFIPMQNPYHKGTYGEVISLLKISKLSKEECKFEKVSSPFIKPVKSSLWANKGCHHLSIINDTSQSFFTIDGFDGENWQIGIAHSSSLDNIKPLTNFDDEVCE